MIITTTHSIEDHKIIEYLGICSGEAIIGANIIRDVFANVRDIVGGRTGSYETVIRSGKDTAIADMKAQALQMGGNAIVGVDLDYEVVGDRGSMMMVVASGTAVLVASSVTNQKQRAQRNLTSAQKAPQEQLDPWRSNKDTNGYSDPTVDEQDQKPHSFGRAKISPDK